MQDMKNSDKFFCQVVQLFRDAKRKPKGNNQIFASKYQTVLPSKEELQQLMNEKE